MNKKAILTAFFIIEFFTLAPSFADNSTAGERYNVYYNNGVTLFREKKYSLAIEEFKKVLRFAPYDKNVKNAIYTAYVSRAEYFLNTGNQPKQAINDLRSALFYMKYWTGTEGVDGAKITSLEKTLNELLNKYENLPATASKFQNAKNLRQRSEIAAAGYEFNKLKNDEKFGFESHVALYDIYKYLGNEEGALNNIREAVKLNPKNAVAHMKYALLLNDINNLEAANDEFDLAFKYAEDNENVLNALAAMWQKRAEQNPNNLEAHINLGALYQKKKQFDLSKAEYSRALEIKPNDKLALSNFASLCVETGEYQEAINLYNRMLEADKNDIKPYFYKAEAYKKLGSNKGAVNEYRKILAITPDNIEAKNGINNIVSSLTGDALINFLKEDAELNPYNAEKQYAVAYELHKTKNYTEAIDYYKKVIALNPKMAEPYINIAQIYRLQEDNTKANAAIAHGLSNLPESKELLAIKKDIEQEAAGNLYNNALNLFNEGKHTEALSEYLKIQAQTPDVPEVLYAIASCYFELGESSKAVEYFEKVLAKNPKDTQAMYFAANSYLNMQNNDKAKELLNKIISLDPKNEEARAALIAINQGEEGKNLDIAINLFEKQDYTNALPLFDKVLTQNPKNAYAHYYKGVIYDETKKKDLAEGEYKKAIEADSNFAISYYSLAVLYDNSEKYKEAVQYYEKYLAKNPDTEDDYSKFVKSRIKELKDYLGQK